ncbi:hypothetical protein OG562_27360 [Streptomyces sp. NBC_01275]|uniref:hypothetical protein n=1 Tax=Streptomyces sp. NBC_01275 TaxID=2903807 RepID=UPI00225A8645|nr:hypothetical protein [Streptomyces sp. NBC_01275]MCX4764618.1 hypothetical protein [Streptomyces sp. NBC_01275]
MGRRAIAVPAPLVLLVLLLTAACTATDDTATHDTRSSRAARSTPSAQANPSAQTNQSAKGSGLDLPAGSQLLVPLTSGTADTDLPAFKPLTDVYTVHARCSGAGTVTIVDRKHPDQAPNRVKCDGPITIGQVYTDPVEQALSVHVSDGAATWRIAVVSGTHAM